MTVKDLVEKLEHLKNEYERLRLLAADQVRDNQITEAKANLTVMENTLFAIKALEKYEVLSESQNIMRDLFGDDRQNSLK